MRISFTASRAIAEIAIDYKNERFAVLLRHGHKPAYTVDSRAVAGLPNNDAGIRLAGIFARLEPVLTRYIAESDYMQRLHMLARIRDELQ